MSDEADDAQDHIEKTLATRLAMVQNAAQNVVVNTTGHCLWCEAEVQGNRRWCCADCRDLWERKYG